MSDERERTDSDEIENLSGDVLNADEATLEELEQASGGIAAAGKCGTFSGECTSFSGSCGVF